MALVICYLLFALVALSLAAVPSNTKPGLRLIALNETSKTWMTPKQVQKLINNRITFIDITDYPNLGEHPKLALRDVPTGPAFQDVVNPLIADLDIDQLIESLRRFSAFPTRYYTTADGEAAVEFLVAEYTRHSSHRDDVTVSKFQNTWRQPSIIVRIEGEGPNADEVVIIGGHIDSTSSSGNAPGADDDGSGSCTVLEVFRALVASDFKPKRSVEFHGYSAEEVGLWGSQAIVQSYVNQGIEVAGMLQLDMTGYVRAGTTETIGVVTDFTDSQLTAFVRTLINTYCDIGWTNTQCGYGCSDHASWYRAGYRASFPFESTFSNSNPYIHSSQDTLNRLNPNHMLEYAKLALAFVVEYSLAE